MKGHPSNVPHRFYPNMNIAKTSFFAAALFLTAALASCRHGEDGIFRQKDKQDRYQYTNPIDSIIHNTEERTRFAEVCKYLTAHPEFVGHSSSAGYHRYSCDSLEAMPLWKDCEAIRVYSIPCPFMYATSSHNIIQFRDSGKIDSLCLEDNIGQLNKLYALKGANGDVHYILKTNASALRHSDVIEEYICAFTFKNGQFAKEKLFHANGKQYDNIEVSFGENGYRPVAYSELVLISLNHFDDGEKAPAFVIAEINDNSWPTGYGLKYQWNGDWFEYVGKCPYNADDYFD